MLIDQDEINALRTAANTATALPQETSAMPAERAAASNFIAAATTQATDLRRILRLRVPVIVQLARRKLAIVQIRRLCTGSIVQFDKSAESPLELMIRNRVIGAGEAVKVGEHFGLRVQQIRSPVQRIRSMGA